MGDCAAPSATLEKSATPRAPRVSSFFFSTFRLTDQETWGTPFRNQVDALTCSQTSQNFPRTKHKQASIRPIRICKGRIWTDTQRLNFVGQKCLLCVCQTSLLHYARGLVDYADSAGGQELFREADVRGFSDYLCTSGKQGGLKVLPGAFGLGLAIFEQIGG